MYSITITITRNHKNQQLQITFRLLKTCNPLHVITITITITTGLIYVVLLFEIKIKKKKKKKIKSIYQYN